MTQVFVADVGMSANTDVRCERDHSDCTDVYVMMLFPMVVIKEDYYLLSVFRDANAPRGPNQGCEEVN